MLERLTPFFRIGCMLLAGLVCYQIARLITHKNPLDDLKIPASAFASNSQPAAQPKSTNSATAKPTNSVSTQPTNSATNIGAGQTTNSAVRAATNIVSLEATNASSRRSSSSSSRRSSSSAPGAATASKDPNISPAVQARIEKVVQSEILGAIVRPLPMALLGIAGKDAFIRAPNGQTGLAREGEEFGGLKILRIDINRVLVEHEGQQKELTLFQGFGSETLLPRGDKKPSETSTPPQP